MFCGRGPGDCNRTINISHYRVLKTKKPLLKVAFFIDVSFVYTVVLSYKPKALYERPNIADAENNK